MKHDAHYKDMIIEILRKEFRVRYKQLALGYVWSIASPLTYAFLYYFVFKIILKVKIESYPLFLIAGLFPWQWLANSILVGPMTFFGNASIIKKTLFPRFLIPLVVVLQEGIHFLISLPIIFVFMLIFHIPLSWDWIWALPLMCLCQFIIAYSANLLIATINLFFRDLERIIQLLMTFLFYLTPVLYSEDMIPEKYRHLLYFHPLAPLMINWRTLIMDGKINLTYLGCSFLWGIILLVIAQTIYRKLQWRLPKFYKLFFNILSYPFATCSAVLDQV